MKIDCVCVFAFYSPDNPFHVFVLAQNIFLYAIYKARKLYVNFRRTENGFYQNFNDEILWIVNTYLLSWMENRNFNNIFNNILTFV